VDDGDRSEYERAGTGYLVWPLALIALVREEPDASNWSRIHTRQAATYGLVVALVALVLFALPLIVVIGWPAISTGATVWVYAAGIVLDIVAFVVFVARSLAYASRATRGELFAIPVVSALADRIFRLRR
jgi:uncharacterized membrane protein